MTEHLDALRLRLSNEQGRLAAARTPGEVELRKVWIAQVEREIAQEEALLGLSNEPAEMTDDEILAELLG